MSTAAFITLVGNVGRIDATKTFEGDRQLATFSVAVSRKFRSKGQMVEETDWYTIKANAPHLISLVEKHVSVGDQLIINGSVSHNVFERNDGSKGMTIEVFAQDLRFNISKKRDNDGSGNLDPEHAPAF